MTTYSPLAVKYPFVTEQGKDYTDLEKLLDDLDAQSHGFYLVGRNNCWHGGIHITDEKFAHHKTTYPVRCMMDGTVIAYRLNQNYPTLSWQPNATVAAKDARYSNGFVLVRHDYGTPKNTEEGADRDKQNTLSFYSLYMHTADYNTYVSAATDTQKTVTITRNTNARSAADVTQIAGVLKQGSSVQVDTAQDPRLATSQGTTYKFYVVTLLEKASGSDEALTVGDTYYLYAGCFPVGTFPESTKKALPSYWKGTITGKTKVRMWVYTSQADCDEHQKAKAVILNSGQTVTFQSSDVQKSTDGKHSMANCQIASGATFAGHTQMTSGWLYVDENQIERQSLVPTQFDSIVTCDYPIKAGETIGFMGIWDRPTAPLASGELTSDYQMHVELFTTDDKAALDKFLQNDAHLKTGKKYLKVPKNTVLYSSDDHGAFVAVHNSLFTAQDYLFEESTLTQEKDRSNTVYYKLKGIRTGEAAIGPVDLYYVKPGGNVKLVTQYDLEELGFATIEETDSSTNGYIDPDKESAEIFKAIFDKLDSNKDIFRTIDSNNNKQLSGEEVKAFLQSDKYLRDKLFKLVAGHPSEWHRTTQNNLKTLVNRLITESTQEETKKLNQFEIDRFEKCEFASQISGLTQKLWHFHPVLFVNNMGSSGNKKLICKTCNKEITITANFMEQIAPGVIGNFYNEFASSVNELFNKYEINTCYQVTHILAQAKIETKRFRAFKESLNYTRLSYTAEKLYRLSPTIINNGFERKGLGSYTRAQRIQYIDDHLIQNDAAYAEHCYGNNSYPNRDYRGRGLLHLTHFQGYSDFKDHSGIDVLDDPNKVATDMYVAIQSGAWFWKKNNAGNLAIDGSSGTVRNITSIINPALHQLDERKQAKIDITNIFKETYGGCD